MPVVYFPTTELHHDLGPLLGFFDVDDACIVAAIMDMAPLNNQVTETTEANDGPRVSIVGTWKNAAPNPGAALAMRPANTGALPVITKRPFTWGACAIVLYDRPLTNGLAAALRLANALRQGRTGPHGDTVCQPHHIETRVRLCAAVQRSAASGERLLRAPLPGDRPALADLSVWARQTADKLEAIQTLPLSGDDPRLAGALVSMAVDAVMGIAAGIVLFANADQWAAAGMTYIHRHWVTDVSTGLAWVMGTPGGVKLNGALAGFLASVFIQYVAWWAGALSLVPPLLPLVLRCVATCGVLGLSCMVCGAWDVFRAVTLHMSLMGQFAGRLHRWALRYLAATWRFFIGSKWNVLRNRRDSSDLGLDQLLLNSVFFTTLLFLFPTVLAYYLFFAMYGLVLVGGTLAVQVGAACLARVPLMQLYMYFADPHALPNEVMFELLDTPEDSPGDYYLMVKAGPVRISRVWEETVAILHAVIRQITLVDVSEAWLFGASLPLVTMPKHMR